MRAFKVSQDIDKPAPKNSMFFGNEKINRKSCSEEKKVEGKIIYFYGLESGLGKARRKTFRVARRFMGRKERFLEFSTIFLENFYNFFGIFCDFFGKFLQFLENFCKNFHNFFRLLRFFGKFFRKFLPTIRYGSTGVSPLL